MTIKWLQSKVGKMLYGAFLGLMLSGLLGAFPNMAFAATCTGSACTGKNPNDYGCTGSTIADRQSPAIGAPAGNGYGHAEVRRSAACNAKWTKITNKTTANALLGATSWWPTGANPPHLNWSTGTTPVGVNAYGYTHMFGTTAYPVKGCGKASWLLSAIAIPIAQNATYCTGFVD